MITTDTGVIQTDCWGVFDLTADTILDIETHHWVGFDLILDTLWGI